MNMISKEMLQPNPIIIKELRSRMRGARAFIVLTLMLLFLAGAIYGIYRLTMLGAQYTTIPGPYIGQTLFQSLLVLELMVICLITPALTAGAISGEREKLTYEMLLTTPLSPAQILWGKLVSAIVYILLLIFAAIPIASLVFIFGGVTMWQMLRGLFVLVIIAMLFGTVGVFMSAWLGRTGRATVLSYMFVLLLFISPIVAIVAVGIYRNDMPPRELLIANPASALFSAILPAQAPWSMRSFDGLSLALAGNFEMMDGDLNTQTRPLYHYSLPLYAAMTMFFYLLAAQFVKPTQRWRINWRASIPVLIIIALLIGLTGFGFWSTRDQYSRAIDPIDEIDGINQIELPEIERIEPPAREATPVAPNEPVQAELPSGPEVPIGSPPELPSGPQVPIGPELPSGPEVPIGSPPELPSGPQVPIGPELPSGPEVPIGSPPELPSSPDLPIGPELPDNATSTEMPSESTTSKMPGTSVRKNLTPISASEESTSE